MPTLFSPPRGPRRTGGKCIWQAAPRAELAARDRGRATLLREAWAVRLYGALLQREHADGEWAAWSAAGAALRVLGRPCWRGQPPRAVQKRVALAARRGDVAPGHAQL